MSAIKSIILELNSVQITHKKEKIYIFYFYSVFVFKYLGFKTMNYATKMLKFYRNRLLKNAGSFLLLV